MNGPLAGIRVFDISNVIAGPFAAALLGDFGAEVYGGWLGLSESEQKDLRRSGVI